MTGTGTDADASIARLTVDHPTAIRVVEEALRKTIKAECPPIVERVDFGNRLIAYGASMRMRDLTVVPTPSGGGTDRTGAATAQER